MLGGEVRRAVDGGFTLIELLVVMIVLGILVAIAIPVFVDQRQRARDAGARSDVNTIGKELANYFGDTTAAPATISVATVGSDVHYFVGSADVGRVSAGVRLVDYNATTTTSSLVTSTMTSTAWCVAVADTIGNAPTIYKYSAASGLEEGGCTSATTP
ncbi:MAG: type II secretion system protein [Solirubrobacteraceae bacterium]